MVSSAPLSWPTTSSRVAVRWSRQRVALHMDFLRVEIKIANAMLDASNTTLNKGTRERRFGRAREASAEVALWLDAALPLARLTVAEHAELIEGLALGLGIGANTTVFSWMEGVGAQPLPDGARAIARGEPVGDND